MAAKPQRMSDLIVVIPGIMGPVLNVNIKPVWDFARDFFFIIC